MLRQQKEETTHWELSFDCWDTPFNGEHGKTKARSWRSTGYIRYIAIDYFLKTNSYTLQFQLEGGYLTELLPLFESYGLSKDNGRLIVKMNEPYYGAIDFTSLPTGDINFLAICAALKEFENSNPDLKGQGGIPLILRIDHLLHGNVGPNQGEVNVSNVHVSSGGIFASGSSVSIRNSTSTDGSVVAIGINPDTNPLLIEAVLKLWK